MTEVRINKFHEDSRILILKQNSQKIQAEIKKLRSWLQKHQNEVVIDSIKEKLLLTLEAYYKYFHVNHNEEFIKDSVEELLSDFLQFPEGKLLSSKSKKKVLGWINIIRKSNLDESNKNVKKTKKYSVENVNCNSQVDLLSIDDPEDWLVDFLVEDRSIFEQIEGNFQQDKVIYVEIDDQGNLFISSLI